MATDRQIAANRLNAQKSTGPTTEAGKARSRRNAVRHGLTAESVVTVLEDAAAYKTFEGKIIGDYTSETAIERALVVRLASLIWRLRRAVAIESGLFQIQGQIVRGRHLIGDHADTNDPLKVFYDLLRFPDRSPLPKQQASDGKSLPQQNSASRTIDPVELAVCFLRLENFNAGKLELVGRYETRLWRQLAQTILILESMRRPPSLTKDRPQLGSIRASQFSAWRWKDST